MKKILLAVLFCAAAIAPAFATVCGPTTVYLPVISDVAEDGVTVEPVTVIECMGVPWLSLPAVLEKKFQAPVVGAGESGMQNINAMAGAIVKLDNEQGFINGTEYKVTGVTVDLAKVNNVNSTLIAAIKKAVAKTFKITESKVTVRN